VFKSETFSLQVSKVLRRKDNLNFFIAILNKPFDDEFHHFIGGHTL
jgi:hypothetical protein